MPRKLPFPNSVRILIVEDDEPTADLLSDDLQHALPGATVDIEHTVAGAMARLNAALDVNQPYDAAILDFKLPLEHLGQTPVSDFSLGRAFRDLSEKSIVAHITAYKKDTEIQEYISHHVKLSEVGRLFVAKEGDWMKELCDELLKS